MVGITICSDKNFRKENCKTLLSNDFLTVFSPVNDFYPFIIEKLNGEITYVLEGKIYDKSMNDIKYFITQNHDDHNKIESFLANVDGEFYLYFIDSEKNQVTVYGDHLNRLPLYYGKSDKRWIVTRNISHAIDFLSSKIIDVNLAEYLVFGFNLKERTIYSNINSLQMENKIEINLKTSSLLTVKKRNLYNLSEKKIVDFSPALLKQLKDLFVESCRNRADENNVLSLSGGLDSRAVASGLKEAGIDFKTVSYEDEEKTAITDVKIAEEISKKLKTEWLKIPLSSKSFLNDINELNESKCGYQPPILYFLNQYLKAVNKNYGSKIVFFTGDGGDKVFPDLSRGINFNNDKKLFKQIIYENYVFSIKEASKLTKVPYKKLKNFLFESIASLNGNNSKEKHEYFLFSCRARRFLFEGEDRNRQHFWATTPFYGRKFFNLIMVLDYKIKQSPDFYGNFLNILNHDIAEIRNENISSGKIVINKTFYKFAKKMADKLLSRRNKEIIKSIIKHSKSPSITRQKYLEQINLKISGCESIDRKYLKKELGTFSLQQTSLILSIINVEDLISKSTE